MSRVPAEEWKEMITQDKLKKKVPSKFMFTRHTCGVCRDGIRFQTAWQYEHEDEAEGGYGMCDFIYSYVCKKCAPTREQVLFLSLNFPKDMPKYKHTVHYM